MAKELTPEFAIQWTKFSTAVVFTWPPSARATRLTKIIFQIGWWIFWIISVIQVIPLFYTMYKKRGSFMQLTESFCIAAAAIEITIKMMIAKYYHHEFQCLIERIETFIASANPKQRDVIMNYVRQITPFHFTYNVTSLVAMLAYALTPLAVAQPFPNEAEYPFSVSEHPAYDIVYLLEVIGGVQAACTGGFNCQLGLFLWYWTIQLEFLAEKVRNVCSSRELKECISRHQDILRSVNETIGFVRPVMIIIVAMATLTIACGGMHIVGNEPVTKKVSFVVIDISYAFELLCIAWAAENLTTACEKVGWALYDSPWIQRSKEFNKIGIIVMQRCQKAPVLGIGGFLPKLSLNYYATYISTTYSFFTALHVMLKKFEKDL